MELVSYMTESFNKIEVANETNIIIKAVINLR